jgi:hypothetical protein
MHNLMTAPFRASRHLAIWIVWQSTGVTLLAPESGGALPRLHERQESAGSGLLKQAG